MIPNVKERARLAGLIISSFLPKPFYLVSVLAVLAVADMNPSTAILPKELVKVAVFLDEDK